MYAVSVMWIIHPINACLANTENLTKQNKQLLKAQYHITRIISNILPVYYFPNFVLRTLQLKFNKKNSNNSRKL